MTESLSEVDQLELTQASQELQHQFEGVQFSQILDEAITELSNVISAKNDRRTFLEVAQRHSDNFSAYIQYLIQLAVNDEDAPGYDELEDDEVDTNIYYFAYNYGQSWDPDPKFVVSVQRDAELPEHGEYINFHGIVRLHNGRVMPDSTTLDVRIPDNSRRYPIKYVFHTIMFKDTEVQHSTLIREVIEYLDSDEDFPTRTDPTIIEWQTTKQEREEILMLSD